MLLREYGLFCKPEWYMKFSSWSQRTHIKKVPEHVGQDGLSDHMKPYTFSWGSQPFPQWCLIDPGHREPISAWLNSPTSYFVASPTKPNFSSGRGSSMDIQEHRRSRDISHVRPNRSGKASKGKLCPPLQPEPQHVSTVCLQNLCSVSAQKMQNKYIKQVKLLICKHYIKIKGQRTKKL